MGFLRSSLPLGAAMVVLIVVQAHAATINVNTFTDELNNDGDCSLREAIQAANSNKAVDQCPAGEVGTDTVLLQPSMDDASVYKLTLGNTDADPKSEDLNQEGDLDVLDDLNIEGSDPAHRSVIDAGPLEDFVSSANPGERVLQVLGTGATLKNLTLQGGNGWEGGGLSNSASDLVLIENCKFTNNFSAKGGGGIYSGGILEIHDSHITQNSTNGSGGGLSPQGRLLMTRTSVDHNVSQTVGGGISSDFGSVLVINTSTISYNLTTGDGGGFYAGGKSDWLLSNATLAFNEADGKGSGMTTTGQAVVYFEKSIVSENAGGENCNMEDNIALFLGSNGYNIENGVTCEFSKTNDLNDDPLLDPNLQDNGGPTPTHALLAGSPAIDQLLNCRTSPTDQRGFARPVDGDAVPGALCDMGAFEFAAAAPPEPEEPGPGPAPCDAPGGCEAPPSAEVCDNDLDDDGNGQIDCDDPACASLATCTSGLVQGNGCQFNPTPGVALPNGVIWTAFATGGLGLWRWRRRK